VVVGDIMYSISEGICGWGKIGCDVVVGDIMYSISEGIVRMGKEWM
jgi:hypothetical protein